MKKKLSGGLMILTMILLVGLSYTGAFGDRTEGSAFSVIPAASDPDWDLKGEQEPTHVDSDVPWEEPGRPAPWSTGIVPTDEEIQQKLDAENVGPLGHKPASDPALRVNPLRGGSPLPAYTPSSADLLLEGFEGGLMPPTGWTVVVNNVETWGVASDVPFEGSNYGTCLYDATYSGTQDEWVISPSIDLTTGGTSWVLDFAWNGSYYWSVDPYDNCDLEVWISTDGGATFSTMLWDEDSYGVFSSWVWYEESISLAAYSAYSDVKIAFHYAGYDGAQLSIDAISVNDAAAPTGRCCYGDPGAPSCVDGIVEAECDAMGGNWSQGLDCTTECPVSGGNDECVAAENIPGPFPAVVSGTTVGATVDCPGVLDWNAVWYKFDVTGACANVTIDYCGTPADAECIGIVVYPDCADCNAYIIASNYTFADCGDGSTNPNMDWQNLPGPATYYIPVFIGDADCISIGADFQFTIDVQDCPPAQPGDNCDEPMVINIGGEGELPYSIASQYTCGRGNNYDATCLGYYDGGEDIFYQLEVSSTVNVTITLDPMGTGWTGIAIDAACPLDASTCIATSTSSSGSPHSIMGLELTPGTYYIQVDTWPSPDCIPDFTLSIEEAAGPSSGDDCTDPISVKLPDDLPYADMGQTNCGRGNNYSGTCLGSYDGGEDIIYVIDVTVGGDFDIILDPQGTTYSGMLLDASCPADPSTCIAKATGSSGGPKGFYGISLSAGIYYIMIDTWPSPNCIPSFNLTIDAAAPPEGNDFWETCEEIGEVVDQAFSTTGTTPDGPGGCMTSANIWYCYTASCSGNATVSLCGSGYDTKLAVYEGNDPYTGTMLGCNDDSPCDGRSLQSEVSFIATAGSTYLIEVGGYSSSTGSGLISIDCSSCSTPPNDNCESVTPATLISGVPVTFTGNNACASEQCSSFPGPHVWEAFTLSSAMDVTLDYCGSSPAFGNAWLNLAIGCPCSDFTIAAVYDFTTCGDGNVTMVWEDLPAGTYYYPVMNDPGNNADGPYTINVVGVVASSLTTSPSAIDFGNVPIDATGSTVLTLGASADQSIGYSISYQYSSRGAGTVPYTDLGSVYEEKPSYEGPANVPDPDVIRQGGDDIDAAVAITVPSVVSGTTTGYTDDYDETCPYSGSTSPDVVYSYSPATDVNIDISLCNSGYDTKLYIYDGAVGNLVDCNDDACPGYRSELIGVALLGGHTYYIIIDGYGGDNGDYEMVTSENTPPEPFACPEGANTEEEACGGDLNGGCNMPTPSFQSIECGETVCGTIWADGGTRDTDWYLLTLYSTVTVTLSASGNFPFIAGIVDTSDCGLASAIDPYGTGAPDDVVVVSREAGPGTYWLFMSHQDYYDYPCGSSNDYWLSVDCPPGPTLWLSAAPENGTVPGNGTSPVTVSYDVTGMDPGFYSADLVITNDGARSVTTVPVSITIGAEAAPTHMFDPDTLFAIDAFAIDPLSGHIYIGDEHMAEDGISVGDVDLGSCTVTLTNSGLPCALTSVTVMASHPDMVGQVLDIAFARTDYLAAEANGSLLFDWTTSNYYVAYTYGGGGGSASLTSSVPIRGHISGDLNLDDRVDISDLTMMVAYLFTGGATPEILELADVNASGNVDIADLTFLVSYMFNGGGAPFHN